MTTSNIVKTSDFTQYSTDKTGKPEHGFSDGSPVQDFTEVGSDTLKLLGAIVARAYLESTKPKAELLSDPFYSTLCEFDNNMTSNLQAYSELDCDEMGLTYNDSGRLADWLHTHLPRTYSCFILDQTDPAKVQAEFKQRLPLATDFIFQPGPSGNESLYIQFTYPTKLDSSWTHSWPDDCYPCSSLNLSLAQRLSR